MEEKDSTATLPRVGKHVSNTQTQPVHRFNRYELKYLVNESQCAELRAAISEHLQRDDHAPVGGYFLESLYFDSPDLDCYTEKVEGLKFRRKLRIRHYGEEPVTWETPVAIEIKQRVNRTTQKRRIFMPFADALRLSDSTGLASALAPKREQSAEDGFSYLPDKYRPIAEEIARMAQDKNLRPIAVTSYRREAFSGSAVEAGIRITIDHEVTGRDRDFQLGRVSEWDRSIIPANMAVVEIKADDSIPLWLTQFTAIHELNIIRMSKYCNTVEALGCHPVSQVRVEAIEL